MFISNILKGSEIRPLCKAIYTINAIHYRKAISILEENRIIHKLGFETTEEPN